MAGIVFQNSYSSVCTAQFKALITAAEDLIDALFIPENSVTVSVHFTEEDAGANAGWGAENGSQKVQVSYAALTGALPSSDVLPSADPAPNGAWQIPQAYARMLGLSNATQGKYDDAVTLNTGAGWSYGQDVINALVHELTEGVMGRIGGLGGMLGTSGVWSTMDLFHYQVGKNGVAHYDVTDGRDGQLTYFSSNAGATTSKSVDLPFFNQFSKSGTFSPGDTGDWEFAAVFGGAGPGQTFTLTQTELNVMSALGWGVTLPQDFFLKTGNWQTPTDWSIGCMPITPEDAYIGVDPENPVTATSNKDVTVNSIGTASGSTLIIGGDSTLTATNGTALNPQTPPTLWHGNIGTTEVDVGSTLGIGNAFDNVGTLDVGYIASGSGGGGAVRLAGDVTLDGGGAVNLGEVANNQASAGNLMGSGLVNVDDKIDGGGLIDVTKFDNQADGVVDAVSPDLSLAIVATTFSNEGVVNVETNAMLQLGATATESVINAGTINIGWDGAKSDADAQLAIRGEVTLSGAGTLAMKGAGAQITSDRRTGTLINDGTILADASSEIGDANNVNTGYDGLTFDNYQTTVATGARVTLTLDTGANTIGDGGGLLEAENGATLAILSNVTTGEHRRLGQDAPPGGTIEAATGGTVTISASVANGAPPLSVSGQVVVASGGLFKVLAGGSVAVPVDIDGASAGQAGGAVEVMTGGALTGSVEFESAGATLELNHTTSAVDLLGSNGAVDLTSASVSVSGGADLFNFAPAFGKDTISGFASSDTIALSKSDFASWNVLQPHIAQAGANTTIRLNANDIITLDNLQKSSLTASNFSFV